MKKIRVHWEPQLEQDLDAMTATGSLFYDAKLTKKIIDEYGSINTFKQSDKFKDMLIEFKK